jgi:hypothetical protein
MAATQMTRSEQRQLPAIRLSRKIVRYQAADLPVVQPTTPTRHD